MKGQSYTGRGGRYYPPPTGYRSPPVTHPRYLPIRAHPHSYAGEGALNVEMSTESPPEWGPQSDLPFISVRPIGQGMVPSLQD